MKANSSNTSAPPRPPPSLTTSDTLFELVDTLVRPIRVVREAQRVVPVGRLQLAKLVRLSPAVRARNQGKSYLENEDKVFTKNEKKGLRNKAKSRPQHKKRPKKKT